LRYWERRGLLRPPIRTRANYRAYDEGSVTRIRFIRAAQDVGFTLQDIRTVLEALDGNRASCGRIRPVVVERLADVNARLRELRRLRGVLTDLARVCAEAGDDDPCPSVERIASSTARAPVLKP